MALAVMVAILLYNIFKKPPPTPATQWVIDTGSKFANRKELTPPDEPTKFTTGDAVLDSALGGGIRTGMVWEISGQR